MKIRYAVLLKFLSKKNLFIGHLPKLNKSKIIINGSNNILFCEEGVKLNKTTISFNANNSLIYLCKGTYKINATIYNNSVLFIGKDNYFNPANKPLNIILSEGKNVFIGNNNLFSSDITIRNADVHLIYNCDDYKRINNSKSIYIGDHIWFGQNVTILKDAKIYSGSIVGAQSVITSSPIYSNCVYAGVPARKIKENVFWEGTSCHAWTKEETNKHEVYKCDNYTFVEDDNTITFEGIEENLNNYKSAYDKYLYLKNLTDKRNRFAKRF